MVYTYLYRGSIEEGSESNGDIVILFDDARKKDTFLIRSLEGFFVCDYDISKEFVSDAAICIRDKKGDFEKRYRGKFVPFSSE